MRGPVAGYGAGMHRGDRGASLVEYVLVVGLVASVAVLALTFLGSSARRPLRDAGTAMSGEAPADPSSSARREAPVVEEPRPDRPLGLAAALIALDSAVLLLVRSRMARPRVEPIVVPRVESADGPVRTLVVDDDQDHRSLLVAVLEASGGFEVVGEAADGREAIEQAERHRPELVLLDLNMPGVTGGEALPVLRLAHPESRIVVLTAMLLPGEQEELLANGATCCVLKATRPADLVAFLADSCRAPARVAEPAPA